MLNRLRLACLALFGLALLCPREARATEYEVFIDIDTEADLEDLYQTGQIDEDTFYVLVELRRRGVDLNSASRDALYALPNLTYDDVDAILAYRDEVGVIRAPADLIAAGVLSREKLGSILTFVQAHAGREKLTATHGWVRYQTAWSQEDNTVPPMVLQARITTLRQLTLGGSGFLMRQQAGPAVWDPTKDSLVAAEASPRPAVPKYFAQWDTERFGVILGSYRIGFGQRLTFDSTNRYTPNGFVLDDAIYRPPDLTRLCRLSGGELADTPCPQGADDPVYYGTPDFRWRDSQRGLAIGAKHLSMPVGWVQLYGFGSWQTRQIYQYDIYNQDTCDDPFSSAENCKSPTVLVANDDERLAPAAAHRNQTLPAMYDEFLGGGNFSWFYDRRTHVGVTGYGATAIWRTEGADLDFRPNATTPFGGSWGAMGADMAWGRAWSDLAFEFARSFDSMKGMSDLDPDNGGGGFAGLLRHTTTLRQGELEITGRYYDKNYANPYAGPISQADQYDGNRARDEAGGRIRYGGRLADRVDLRALADVWVQPSEGSPKLQSYVRADVDATSWFRPGLWVEYRNVDLRPDSTVGCIDDGSRIDQDDRNEDGDPTFRSGCLAQIGKLTGRLGFRPLRKRNKNRLSIIAQYRHEIMDEPAVDRLRQDANATLIVRANPISSFRIESRLRYTFEDIKDPTRFEESVWAYLSLSYTFKKVFMVRARYDLYAWLDERDSTANRIPNPEHRLRLQLEARF